MLGKAALKSKRTMAPFCDLRLTLMASNSTSTTLLSMERPRMKPRCLPETHSPKMGSQRMRRALGSRRLSVLTTDKGLVSAALWNSVPSSCVPAGFFGMQQRMLRLNSCESFPGVSSASTSFSRASPASSSLLAAVRTSTAVTPSIFQAW